MAGGGGWLAFRMLARHVTVMVERRLHLFVSFGGSLRGLGAPRRAAAVRTCGPRIGLIRGGYSGEDTVL